MNSVHARFRIANVDFLCVLSTFVFEPIRWNARFGWRRMTETERLGWLWFWRGVGELIRIENLPEDFERLERFSRDFEAEHFRFTDANRQVALATREMFAGWFPRPLRPLVRQSINSLLDPPLLAAFGLRPAPRWLERTIHAAMRTRALALRWFPKRSRPVLSTKIARAYHPQVYRIESLGPPPFDGKP